jgi:hypothetical protein
MRRRWLKILTTVSVALTIICAWLFYRTWQVPTETSCTFYGHRVGVETYGGRMTLFHAVSCFSGPLRHRPDAKAGKIVVDGPLLFHVGTGSRPSMNSESPDRVMAFGVQTLKLVGGGHFEPPILSTCHELFFPAVLPLALSGLVSFGAVFFLWKRSGARPTLESIPVRVCGTCGYDLRAHTEMAARCPECGTTVLDSQRKSASIARLRKWGRRGLRGLLLVNWFVLTAAIYIYVLSFSFETNLLVSGKGSFSLEGRDGLLTLVYVTKNGDLWPPAYRQDPLSKSWFRFELNSYPIDAPGHEPAFAAECSDTGFGGGGPWAYSVRMPGWAWGLLFSIGPIWASWGRIRQRANHHAQMDYGTS